MRISFRYTSLELNELQGEFTEHDLAVLCEQLEKHLMPKTRSKHSSRYNKAVGNPQPYVSEGN